MWFTPPLGVSGTALTLLMPVSSAYAWYSIGLREDPTWTFSWQLGPAALYWLWAWKNRCVYGPRVTRRVLSVLSLVALTHPPVLLLPPLLHV